MIGKRTVARRSEQRSEYALAHMTIAGAAANRHDLSSEIAAQSDRLKGKPAQAMEKIIQGVLEKFYQSYCLVDQGFVKKNSEVSVKEHVGSVAKQLGDDITIRRFVRFQVGESAA